MFPAIKLAGDSLFSNPFSFVKDVTAILFVGFTYAFGIYVILKGYGYQDEYPGYSRKHIALTRERRNEKSYNSNFIKL